MYRVTVTVKPEAGGALARLRAGWRAGLNGLSAQALADCNRYARDESGKLRRSAYAASDLPAGRLVWRTSYARRVYYMGTPSHAHNPLASLRWCERAKAMHGAAWRRTAADMLGGAKP